MASSTIIKNAVTSPGPYVLTPRPSRSDPGTRALAGALAHRRPDLIIAEAKARASALLEEAARERERQMDALRASALAQARSEVKAQTDATLASFRDIMNRAVVAEQDMRDAARSELHTLAIAIAEAIIGREISLDPSVIDRTVSDALAHAPSSPLTHIIVHPDDVETVERWARASLGDAWNSIELVPDQHITRGGCVIGTRTGFLDARIETQLAEIRRGLSEAFGT